MKIHKNIGNFDFAIRLIILIGFILLTIYVSRLFILLVFWEVFVLVTRWCPVYDFLGISTYKKKK